jgi:hypothetical protein
MYNFTFQGITYQFDSILPFIVFISRDLGLDSFVIFNGPSVAYRQGVKNGN